MKIAMFSDCFLDLTGGIVTSIRAQKLELEKLGHKVYVFSTGYRREKTEIERLAREKIFVVPSCLLLFLGLTPVSRRPRIIERWILKNFPEIRDFDVFHIHYEAGCLIAGVRLGRQLGIPVIQTMHGREDMGITGVIPFGLRTLVAIFLNWFHSWYLRHDVKVLRDNFLATNLAKAKMWTMMVNHANQADLVLTPSKHFGEKLKYYGVRRPIEVMPNGVADKQFELGKVRELLAGEELRIVWHSRVSAEKRILPFLDALSQVRGRYKLEVFGEGRELAEARRFAEERGVNAVFYGNVEFSRVLKALNKAHLDVLVSYNGETFGMILIEAAAAGIPVLICDPDMKEIVPEEGCIFSGKEPEEMAAAISWLIDNPERLRKMSEVMMGWREEARQSRRIEKLVKIYQKQIKYREDN